MYGQLRNISLKEEELIFAWLAYEGNKNMKVLSVFYPKPAQLFLIHKYYY